MTRPPAYLFVDDGLVECADDAWRALHQATKDPANPTIVADRPWENGVFCGSSTVLRDEAARLYLIWNHTHSGRPEGSLTAYASSAAAIPGYSREDAEPIAVDSVAHEVRWRDGRTLAELRGRAVRPRLMMRQADLYSFRFVDA